MPDTETEEAQPTPGPVSQGVTSSDERRIAKVLKGTDMVGNHNVYCDIHSERHHIKGQEPAANADLIVAAFNAAHALPPEYNPVETQKQIPDIVEVADKFFHWERHYANSPRENILNAIEDQVAEQWARDVFNELRTALQKARGDNE